MGLFRRLWPMHHDVLPNFRARHRRHRGRPALVRSQEHLGATERWSPIAELAEAEAVGQPEETEAEAARREVEERFADIVDHWAAEYARIEAEVRSWFDELVANDPIAKQLLAEERERLARKASVDAAATVDVPTGEYALVVAR